MGEKKKVKNKHKVQHRAAQNTFCLSKEVVRKNLCRKKFISNKYYIIISDSWWQIS